MQKTRIAACLLVALIVACLMTALLGKPRRQGAEENGTRYALGIPLFSRLNQNQAPANPEETKRRLKELMDTARPTWRSFPPANPPQAKRVYHELLKKGLQTWSNADICRSYFYLWRYAHYIFDTDKEAAHRKGANARETYLNNCR